MAWRAWSPWLTQPAMAEETQTVLNQFPLMLSGVWWGFFWGNDALLPDAPGSERLSLAPPLPQWTPSGAGSPMAGPAAPAAHAWTWGRQAMAHTDATAFLANVFQRGRGRLARFFLACGARPSPEDAEPQRTQSLCDALDASSLFAVNERAWLVRALLLAGWRGHERLLWRVLKRATEREDDLAIVHHLIEHDVSIAPPLFDVDRRRPSVALWHAARMARWTDETLPTAAAPLEDKGGRL